MRFIGSVLAAVAALALLVPARGVDTDPPQCWSVFDYRVPCGSWLSVGSAIGAAGLVYVLIRLVVRKRIQ